MPYKNENQNKKCKSDWAKSPTGKAKMKEYYEKNKERILARDKEQKRLKFEALSEEEKKECLRKRCEMQTKSYHKHKHENKEFKRDRAFKAQLKYSYNITLDQYYELLEKQQNKCAICGCKEYEKRWISSKLPFAIDHNHETNEVRGLLCDNCNVMIGHAHENTIILENAIKYLNNDKN